MSRSPDIQRLLDELEANRRSRKSAWATLQRLRKFLEAAGARISIPEERSFETEGDAIESGLRRTIAGRDAVMRSLIRAVYRFRDATLVAEKKDDFGSALQNLYRELERAEDVVLLRKRLEISTCGRSGRQDLNLRPPAPKAGALPS